MRGQSGAILEHLKTYGSLTSMEAFEKYGATRLAARIHEFRKLGYDIETHELVRKNRYGETCTFAKYVYNGYHETDIIKKED